MFIGHVNAMVGADNTTCDRNRAMGKHGCGVINDNGERLVDFCLNNDSAIGGTIFPNKKIHNLTWRSPVGTTVNQIDHSIVNTASIVDPSKMLALIVGPMQTVTTT